MNFVAFATALTAHNMLASQRSEYVWQVLDCNGAVLGEILDGLKGASIRNSVTPAANRPAIRSMIKSMKGPR